MIQIYGVMRLVPDDSRQFIEYNGQEYVWNNTLYYSFKEATDACAVLNARWRSAMNPINYYIAHDANRETDDSLTLRQKRLLGKIQSNGTAGNIDFTKYWDKLGFPGVHSVGHFHLTGDKGSEPVTIPTTRKLEV